MCAAGGARWSVQFSPGKEVSEEGAATFARPAVTSLALAGRLKRAKRGLSENVDAQSFHGVTASKDRIRGSQARIPAKKTYIGDPLPDFE